MQNKHFHNIYYNDYCIHKHKLDVTNHKIFDKILLTCGFFMACQIQNTEFRNSRVECIK